jgi:hypothetical protein
MRKLESFSWDMLTGILRDVFEALWDIEILKSVHIRFHDTRNTHCQVEKPTFKGFKGLRTLSVLDIDEAQYIVEMADAIENSVDTLEALRVESHITRPVHTHTMPTTHSFQTGPHSSLKQGIWSMINPSLAVC